MASALENLAGPGKALRAEPPDAVEIAGLIRSGKARLKDASSQQLALESRFDLAYNAAHAPCLAALRRKGWRAANRSIVFQVLPHTLGLGPPMCFRSSARSRRWHAVLINALPRRDAEAVSRQASSHTAFPAPVPFSSAIQLPSVASVPGTRLRATRRSG